MKIGIIGASGNSGSRVLAEAHRGEHEVAAFTQGREPPADRRKRASSGEIWTSSMSKG